MTRDPLATIRRHGGRMTPGELDRVVAAAIVQGDDAAADAALSAATPAARRAWAGIARTLERAHVVMVHAADVLPLADRAARLAALADVRAALAGAAPPGELAALARAEHADRSAAAALALAGIRSWCLEATGADALDLLAALAAASLADPAERMAAAMAPHAPDDAAMPAWWQDARETIARALEAYPADPEAVELAADEWADVAPD